MSYYSVIVEVLYDLDNIYYRYLADHIITGNAKRPHNLCFCLIYLR